MIPPNFAAAYREMSREWSLSRLELYICSHKPGLERDSLHNILHYEDNPGRRYLRALVSVAFRLLEAGHILSPLDVLQEQGLCPMWWGQTLPVVEVSALNAFVCIL